MNPKGETGIGCIFAVLIIAIIALSLVGCKTKEHITDIVQVHDTVEVVKADTLKEVKVQTIRDTTIQKEVHTYTINNVGDTVKETHHYHEREKIIVVDSTDRYKAVVDSLRKALHDEKSKDKVVVKTKYLIRWWEWVIFAVLLVFFAILAIKKKTTSKSS